MTSGKQEALINLRDTVSRAARVGDWVDEQTLGPAAMRVAEAYGIDTYRGIPLDVLAIHANWAGETEIGGLIYQAYELQRQIRLARPKGARR